MTIGSHTVILALAAILATGCGNGTGKKITLTHSIRTMPGKSAKGHARHQAPNTDSEIQTDEEAGESSPDPGSHDTVRTEAPPGDSIGFYQKRYELPDIFRKLVGDRGKGPESLYGVRNFRAVLNGVVYRGGANNVYHRQPRENHNPLPTDGLENLCREGFSTAIYLYNKNFDGVKTGYDCSSVRGGPNHLTYRQLTAHSRPKDAAAILKLVHAELSRPTPRPIYMHCWNGWHASGYISALILRQFCGVSPDAAVEYWNKNTDGNFRGRMHDVLRKRIRDFVPDPQLNIDAALKARVCPKQQ